MIRWRWTWALGAALAVAMGGGAALAVEQGQEVPPEGVPGQPAPFPDDEFDSTCPMGEECPCPHCPGAEGGACPMMRAHRSLQRALQAGATLTTENTEDGAIIRLEAPRGEQEAVLDAQQAARLFSEMMRGGEASEGCPCPMMKQGGAGRGPPDGAPRRGR